MIDLRWDEKISLAPEKEFVCEGGAADDGGWSEKELIASPVDAKRSIRQPQGVLNRYLFDQTIWLRRLRKPLKIVAPSVVFKVLDKLPERRVEQGQRLPIFKLCLAMPARSRKQH